MSARHSIWARSLALVGAAAIVAAGCGGGGTVMSQQPASGINRNPGNQTSGPVTWQLTAGANRRAQAFQALNFFADLIVVDEGDSITWTVGGNAHTITFFGPLNHPRRPLFGPFGGSSYDGTVYTSSGALFPGQTYTLTFPKAGTYPYECLFHDPEMSGVVIVQTAGTRYPHTQAYYNSVGMAEMNRELDGAIGSLDEFPFSEGGTTLAAGIAPGLASGSQSHSTVLRFLDGDSINNTVTIPVGTTLTWSNQTNNEPHTVTFPKAGQPLPPLRPFGPPLGGSTYNGNRVTSSGPLFPGQSYSLTFTAQGDFTYYCLIHAPLGMMGVVKVR